VLTDDQLFATVVCDEAANQPHEGKVAVAIVVLNRTATRYESDGSLAGTLYASMQFSGLWDDYVNGHYTRVAFTRAEAAARAQQLFLTYDSSKAYADAMAAIADARAWEAGTPMSFTPGPAFAGLTKKTVLYLNPRISHAAWATPAKQDAVLWDHTFFHA
jgi:Cell Wall Hydrolase